MKELLWNGARISCTENGVALDGKEIEMPRMERKLFLFLLENHDEDLSRDRLLREVWDYGAPGVTRTVDTHVKNLRAHLGEGGRHIHTVRGIGYRLEGAPEQLCCCRCA